MRGVHYYPSGALCWFETNQYGDPTGSVYYIKKVPDMELLKIPQRQRGYKKLMKDKSKKYSMKESLIKDKPDSEVWSYEKPCFDKQQKG